MASMNSQKAHSNSKGYFADEKPALTADFKFFIIKKNPPNTK